MLHLTDNSIFDVFRHAGTKTPRRRNKNAPRRQAISQATVFVLIEIDRTAVCFVFKLSTVRDVLQGKC